MATNVASGGEQGRADLSIFARTTPPGHPATSARHKRREQERQPRVTEAATADRWFGRPPSPPRPRQLGAETSVMFLAQDDRQGAAMSLRPMFEEEL